MAKVIKKIGDNYEISYRKVDEHMGKISEMIIAIFLIIGVFTLFGLLITYEFKNGLMILLCLALGIAMVWLFGGRNEWYRVDLDFIQETTRSTIEQRFFIRTGNPHLDKSGMKSAVFLLTDIANEKIKKEEFLRKEEELLIEGL